MEPTVTNVEVLGRRVQEARGGEGKPLLYLHSAMGEASWMMPHLAALAARRELHAPAHPGFLKSQGIDQIRDMADLVDHYLAYLDVLGWDSVDVVGHSLGGWIGAELAVRVPERISTLVLSGAVGIWIREKPLADIFAFNPQRPEHVAELLFHDTSNPFAQAMTPKPGWEMPDELMIDFMNAMAATARVGWNPLLHNPRLEAKLQAVRARTLCLWGENDRVAPMEYGRKYASLIPGAQLEVIPSCGHMSFLEKPTEWSGAVLRFLG